MAAPAPKPSSSGDAVAEALTRRGNELERVIRRRFPALEAAEVLQRAAIRALERSDELRDLERVDAWIRRIAITCALDLLRERQRREIPTAEPPDVPAPTPLDDETTCTCSMTLLGSLPASYADMLERVDVQGDSLEEVANALHIDKGNATVRLHRARRALRGRLRDHCGVESMRQCLTCVCAEQGSCSTSSSSSSSSSS